MAAIVSSGDPKWFPVNHGGEFRKWYGNNESVINWENDGKEIKALAKSKYNSITRTVTGMGSYFKPGVTWTAISSCRFGSRKFDSGYLFTNAGMCAFGTESKINLACSFLNSLIAATYLEFIAPTVNFGPNQVKLLPLPDDSQLEKVAGDLAERMVSRARADWDNFETSWDFRDQPLLRPGLKGATLEASWRNWEAQSTAAIRRMQELETENNRLFIAAYGLDGELQPEVPEDQITLARAEAAATWPPSSPTPSAAARCRQRHSPAGRRLVPGRCHRALPPLPTRHLWRGALRRQPGLHRGRPGQGSAQILHQGFLCRSRQALQKAAHLLALHQPQGHL
jgi:hypothetical protein